MTPPVWNRKQPIPMIPRIISAVVVVGMLAAMIFAAWDLMRVEVQNAPMPGASHAELRIAGPKMKAEWAIVRTNLEDRLRQTSPLYLGAVWATRTGQVCGLVDGRGSFGGLSGMMRFYSVDRRPVFHDDIDHVQFQKAWFQCQRDRYAPLHQGTEEKGFCGTELGQRRCYLVKNGVRID